MTALFIILTIFGVVEVTSTMVFSPSWVVYITGVDDEFIHVASSTKL